MKRTVLISILLLLVIFVLQSSYNRSPLVWTQASYGYDITPDSLRKIYEGPISEWPEPWIDSGVEWQELAALPGPDSNYAQLMESPIVKLGKYLFFDPILSGSNQISCSTCHNPQTSWADKLSVSVGHDHQTGTRNTPSLLNVRERKTLFWDGRAGFLEEQALSPIEAHHEMNMDLTKLIPKLKAIDAYNQLFMDAFGEENYSMPEVLSALAAFQRTLTSRQSRFDRFILGQKNALTTKEIHGLHLFRTNARCMNCHHGVQFTDELFHNVGLTYYGRKYEDLGRYEVTGDPDDVGKFRTPSLRDVMNTDPWMHNGLFDNMTGILNLYNSGMQSVSATPEQKLEDPLYPVTDPLLKPLNLSRHEIEAIESFLHAITATPYKMPRPESLPR